VIAHGGAEEYEAVLKLFRESDFSEEKRRYLKETFCPFFF